MYGVLSIDVSITVAVNLMPVLALAKNRELEYPWGQGTSQEVFQSALAATHVARVLTSL